MKSIILVVLGLTVVATMTDAAACNEDLQTAKSLKLPLTDFSVNLYKKLSANDQAANVVFSPVSVALALAMLEHGAGGSARQQLKSALSNVQVADMFVAYQSLQKNLQSNTDQMKFLIANGLFIKKGLTFANDYQNDVKKCFNGQVKDFDFAGDAEGSRTNINSWVANVTNQKIPSLLPAGSINAATMSILLNAVYLKGLWRSPFMEQNNKQLPFNEENGQKKQMTFMRTTKYCDYASNDNVQAVRLSLQGSINMEFYLPKQGSLSDLEQWLTGANLLSLHASFSNRRVELQLPKFTTRSKSALKDILQRLGLADVFSPTADFSRMLSNGASMTVSSVLHEAFISVDEKGVEAAAATAVFLAGSALDQTAPVPFHLDRPFLYTITHSETGAVLFMGKFKSVPAAARQ